MSSTVDNIAPGAGDIEKDMMKGNFENSPTTSMNDSTELQQGVTKVEAAAQAWGKTGLMIAYLG